MYIEGKGTNQNFEVGLRYLKTASESPDATDEIREAYNKKKLFL